MHPDRAASTQRWHIQVSPRRPDLDGQGRDVLADVRQMGLEHIEGVRSSRIYLLEGRLLESDVRLLAEELLCDPVAEVFEIREGFARRDGMDGAIEVHPLPGVMNPAALSTLDAAGRLLAARRRSRAGVEAVQTARRYIILGARNAPELEQIAARVLANHCIETCFIRGFGRSDPIPEAFPAPRQRPFALRHIFIGRSTDDELTRLSREAHLFLSLAEMRAIRDHFAKLNREPTDLELETLAQTWSEHCVHKTLKSSIVYRGEDFGRSGQVEVRFANLLKDTIVAATAKLNRDWCLSVFVDNAGIVAFDEEYGMAFKVETHNHPSAIEPYGGAATGVGGCIRDIMGCGLGAKPIASTDVFCLAPPDFDPNRLPAGVLHPRRVLKGVVGGVRDYGNRMGIPTVNGAIYFDERYLANPLVFCGCIGLIPRDRIAKKPRSGDFIVVAGGRTGRDGIHGATFSSAELTEQHADEFAHAVQIGNAIEEKKLLDALLIARDDSDGCLYSSVTDCGAGGLSSAVGEMGAELGAVVDLEKVPLKYSGLRYDEIWISEAQERMVFAVPPDGIDRFLSVFTAEEVEATVIGTFTDDRILRVRYNGQSVGELEMAFLHDGLPRTERTASWHPEPRASIRADDRQHTPDAANDVLLQSLNSLNVASKEWVIRQYDHEVQGRSVLKPLVGPGFGPSDAAVLRPRYTSYRGIAIGCGLCPEWTDVDPYWMAVRAIDEALRNVICVGGDPDRTSILDNFCWPKCDSEESLGALVRACRGASDTAIAYGLPFISGKDSLNNEFSMSADEARRTGLPQRIAIPGTLLVSALAQIEDVRHCISMDLKEPGNCLVLASSPVDEYGMENARSIHHLVSHCIRDRKVRSAHDVSDGGLATAVAEMCIASGLGAAIDLPLVYEGDLLFTPVATTYVLEMKQADAAASGVLIIGQVTKQARLSIARGQSSWISLGLDDMARAWRSPLAHGGGP